MPHHGPAEPANQLGTRPSLCRMGWDWQIWDWQIWATFSYLFYFLLLVFNVGTFDSFLQLPRWRCRYVIIISSTITMIKVLMLSLGSYHGVSYIDIISYKIVIRKYAYLNLQMHKMRT